MVELKNVSKIYHKSGKSVSALDNVSLRIEKGEFIVIKGPSGSGKTTLLLTVAGLLRPVSGTVLFNNRDIYALNQRSRENIRAGSFGFIFQRFHLVPYLNVLDNVLLASPETGHKKDEAENIIKRLGIRERSNHKVKELSTGERQRTAIARAFLNSPDIILADEPTGNLDGENASEVLKYLSEFHKSGGTVLLVTHGTIPENIPCQTIRLNNGKIMDQ